MPPSRVLAAALAAGLTLATAAGAQTFSNPTPFTIPDFGAASLYPSDILVSGIAEPVTRVTVTVSGFVHSYPRDVDVMVVGPAGQNLILMSDVGIGLVSPPVTFVFDDLASNPLPSGNDLLASGTWQPTNIGVGSDDFPAPAPTPSAATSFATFDGTDANGLWSLYVTDDAPGDGGSVGGWSITFAPEPQVAGPSAALLALAALALRRGGNVVAR